MRILLATIFLTMLLQPTWAELDCKNLSVFSNAKCLKELRVWEAGETLYGEEKNGNKVEGILKVAFKGTRQQLIQSFKDQISSWDKTVSYNGNHWLLRKKGCASELERYEAILENCQISNFPDGEYSIKHKLITSKCEKIACKPNWAERLRY